MGKKEYNYFHAFLNSTQVALDAAQMQVQHWKEFDHVDAQTYGNTMHIYQQQAYKQRIEIMEALAKEFLPPIEREDIVMLNNVVYDLVEAIVQVSSSMYVYHVQDMKEEAIAYGDVLLQCCEAVRIMMKEFSNFQKSKKLQSYIFNVSALVEKGKLLNDMAIRQVFTSDLDAVEVMKWTSIYKRLECACAICDRVGRIVECIVLKNS